MKRHGVDYVGQGPEDELLRENRERGVHQKQKGTGTLPEQRQHQEAKKVEKSAVREATRKRFRKNPT